MKENKYDDKAFFEKYRQMPRSVQGLEAAGEWHALKKLLPPLKDASVLDLGCGFGWHCRYAAEQGAARVLGVDLSDSMLDEAKRTTPHPTVCYERSSIEDFTFPEGGFDVVISSLALHYVEGYAALCRNVAASLRPGGTFVFSVEHPIFTAQGPQDWHYDAKGKPDHWPVDRYFEQGVRTAVFLDEPVTKYHRTVTAYVQGLLNAGLAVTALVEPEPDPAMLDSVPGMRDELRRPMMLLLSARRPG